MLIHESEDLLNIRTATPRGIGKGTTAVVVWVYPFTTCYCCVLLLSNRSSSPIVADGTFFITYYQMKRRTYGKQR